MKSSLSILYFIDHALGVVPKKSLPYPRSLRFSPTLFSRSFIVLKFTFMSVIHFELMFVKRVRSVSSFFFLAALGLHCCMRAFSNCGEQGLLFVVVHRLLIVVASLVAEHGL